MFVWSRMSRQKKREADEKKWADMQHKIDDLRAMVALIEANFTEIESSRVSTSKDN